MISRGLLVVPVLCALSLGACGFANSPAAGLTFVPPPGWRPSPGIMGFMQFWRPPSRRDEVLMLFKIPKTIPPRDWVSQAHGTMFTTAQYTQGRIVVNRRITICGDQTAQYVLGNGTSDQSGTRGRDETMQMIATSRAGVTYFALYVHPTGRPASPRAVDALHELCPKP